MKYIAHIRKNDGTEQTLKEHLEGTAKLAKEFSESFGYGEWGYFSGKLHDIGKYSEKFQKRIRGDKNKVDHATAGAQVCKKIAETGDSSWSHYVGYCIAGHHAGLPSTGSNADTSNSKTYIGRLKKKVEEYNAFETEISIPSLKQPFYLSKVSKNPTFSVGFFIRMLYSCLVDADFLDTEKFMLGGENTRKKGEDINTILEKLNKYVKDWRCCEEIENITGRRTEILKHCMEKGGDEQGLYRLTVPTG